MKAHDAITQYVGATNGTRFAYRKIGTASGVPLICHNHFRGNMDWWDPLLLNNIAERRTVILFDSTGVGRTAGEVPVGLEGQAKVMIEFVEALEIKQADFFGFSFGGRVVQMAAILRPDLARKLILAGSSPVLKTPDSPTDVRDPKYMMGVDLPMATARSFEESQDAFRLALFGESDLGRKQFNAYWSRLEERSAEPPLLDALELENGGKNQIDTILNADSPENIRWPDRVPEMKMPVLVCNGHEDLVLGTIRTLDLFHRLPNAQLILYPKSGHGFLWQYPELFGKQVSAFLDTDAFSD